MFVQGAGGAPGCSWWPKVDHLSYRTRVGVWPQEGGAARVGVAKGKYNRINEPYERLVSRTQPALYRYLERGTKAVTSSFSN